VTTCIRCGCETQIRTGAPHHCGKCILALAWGEVAIKVPAEGRRTTQVEQSKQ
jgi:hypothetical protein